MWTLKDKILANLFARVAYTVLRLSCWKRKTVAANVCYTNAALKNPPRYNELLKNLTRHVGELLFCFKFFKKLPHDFSQYPCRVCGFDFAIAKGSVVVLEKMRAGGIFLTAHYGNYEAMGPWLCCLGIPLVASYIPVKPKWLNVILERKIRAVNGKSYSVNAKTPRDFMRLLDSRKLFCLLADQDCRIPSAMEGLFLGRPVNVNPLPDFLLKHYPELPVYICWIEEVGGTRCGTIETNKLHILHAIEVKNEFEKESEHLKNPVSKNQLHVMSGTVISQFNKWLEERIAENPNLWYGFTHRRFFSCNPEIYHRDS